MRLKKFSNKNIIYFSTNQIDLVRNESLKKINSRCFYFSGACLSTDFQYKTENCKKNSLNFGSKKTIKRQATTRQYPTKPMILMKSFL
jgi:hypothetical protein